MTEAAPPVSSAWSQGPALDLAAAARQPVDAVLHELGSTQTGLTSDQAARRLATVGRNVLASHKVTALGVLGRQLRNPLLILLLAAAGVSAATGDPTDGAIIAAIVVLSVGLGDDACSHLPPPATPDLPSDLRKWSPRSDSNRRPSDYESDRNPPTGPA